MRFNASFLIVQLFFQVIELQNEKMATMDDERKAAQVKFREELDKASRAMRQEVERMREVCLVNILSMSFYLSTHFHIFYVLCVYPLSVGSF